MSLSGVQTRIRSTRGRRRRTATAAAAIASSASNSTIGQRTMPERLDGAPRRSGTGRAARAASRPTTCSPGTGRCGTIRSPGPWRSRRASRPPRGAGTAAGRTAPRRPRAGCRRARGPAGAARSAPGTARRSRRRGGAARSRRSVADGTRLDELLEPAEVAPGRWPRGPASSTSAPRCGEDGRR